MKRVVVFAALAASLALAALWSGATAEPRARHPALERYLNRHAPALVFSPTIGDVRGLRQLDVFRAAERDLNVHKVAIVTVLGNAVFARGMRRVNARELRDAFNVREHEMLIILLGPDGAERGRWVDEVAPEVMLRHLNR